MHSKIKAGTSIVLTIPVLVPPQLPRMNVSRQSGSMEKHIEPKFKVIHNDGTISEYEIWKIGDIAWHNNMVSAIDVFVWDDNTKDAVNYEMTLEEAWRGNEDLLIAHFTDIGIPENEWNYTSAYRLNRVIKAREAFVSYKRDDLLNSFSRGSITYSDYEMGRPASPFTSINKDNLSEQEQLYLD